MINNQLLREAPIFAMKNRNHLQGSCGCYFCLAIFPATNITQWTDQSQTALCPLCGVDSVLPEDCGISLDEETLKQIHNHWF